MLRDQLKANAVALVSLVVALSALGYNTWRNELTEHNRNIRFAGFEMLLRVSELRRISYIAHYDRDTVRGNPRAGWVEVQVIRDLGMIMPESLQRSANRLFSAWEREWQGLGNSDASIAAIEAALDEVRTGILETLGALE